MVALANATQKQGFVEVLASHKVFVLLGNATQTGRMHAIVCASIGTAGHAWAGIHAVEENIVTGKAARQVIVAIVLTFILANIKFTLTCV